MLVRSAVVLVTTYKVVMLFCLGRTGELCKISLLCGENWSVVSYCRVYQRLRIGGLEI